MRQGLLFHVSLLTHLCNVYSRKGTSNETAYLWTYYVLYSVYLSDKSSKIMPNLCSHLKTNLCEWYSITRWKINRSIAGRNNLKLKTLNATKYWYYSLYLEQEVVEFCRSYLVVNREAFCDPRLELIINDARYDLSKPARPTDYTSWYLLLVIKEIR